MDANIFYNVGVAILITILGGQVMRTKKVIAFILATILLVSLGLSGCNKDEATSTKDDKPTSSTGTSEGTEKEKPLTLKVFVGGSAQQPTKDNRIYKMIEEELNVKFDFEFLVGDLDQKLGVMIASGDYADLVDSANSTEKSINGGVYIPLNDLINDSTPNLKAHYDGYMKQIASTDGNIYVLPNYGVYKNYIQTTYNGPAFWIQKAVLKEFNFPVIKTLDQYFKVIEDYKAKYPEIEGQPTIGYEVLSFDWRAFCLKNAPAQLLGSPNDGGVIVDPATSTASLYANTDGAKKYYQKLNEEYNKGIIEADTFVMNYDEYIARLSSGRVLGMFDQGWDFQLATDSLIDQEKIERTWIPVGITFDESIVPYYRDRPAVNINRGFGISVDAKEPERIMQIIDTLLSERWQKILTWGIEGVDYLVDDKGLFYRTEEQRANFEDVNWQLANRAKSLWESLPKLQGTFDDGNSYDPNEQPVEYTAKLREVDKEILAGYGYTYIPEFLGEAPENRKDYPAWSIALGDGTEAAIADTKISELQVKYLPQLILSDTDEFDGGWADYVKEYDSVDVAAYLKRVNEGIQERLNLW